MFGHTFAIPHNKDKIVMRKASPADATHLADYMEDYIASQFVVVNFAPLLKDEEEWIEKCRTDRDSYVWMIDYVKEGEKPVLAGVTSLHRQSENLWSSGIFLSNRSLWRLGIASATHRLRTWYAFAELNAFVIESGYVADNKASGKALWSVGYVESGVLRRCRFSAGNWRDLTLMTCYNPAVIDLLWQDAPIPKDVLEASYRTRKAMNYASGAIIKPR